MPTVVGFNTPVNMGDPIQFGAMIYSVGVGGTSSSAFTTQHAQTGGRWQFTGTGFGSYQGGIPNSGTVTGIAFTQNNIPMLTITGMSVSMTTIFQYIAADNMEGLLGVIFAGADNISGSTGYDNLFGYGGNDVITGGPGGDAMNGMGGDDTINAGEDFDMLWGEDGNDTLNGNGGSDQIRGGNGDDVINGGSWGDYLYGDAGNDTINGGDDGDIIYSGTGVDHINGQAGDDRLVLDRANATVALTFDAAAMASDAGITLADGSTIRSVERYALTTGSGADVFNINVLPSLIGLDGNHIDGGAGHDTLTVDFSTATETVSTYLTWANIESVSVIGGAANDYITGGSGDDYLRGGAGDDTLNGGGGGVDILDGGEGLDTVAINFESSTQAVSVSIGAASTPEGTTLPDGTIIRNIEQFDVRTGSGDDTLDLGTGFTGDHVFLGWAGTDTVIGDFSGSNTPVIMNYYYWQLTWGSGRLTAHADRFVITGGGGNDQLHGATINGYVGDDIFNGGDGADIIRGYGGADTMNGGAGDDTIYLDTGADMIDGGSGADTLVVTVPYLELMNAVTFSPMDFSGVFTSTGALLPTGAHARNMENLDASLSYVDDIIIVGPGITGSHRIDAEGGIDVLQGDFTGETRSVVVSIGQLFVGGQAVIWQMVDVERLNIIGGSGNDRMLAYDYDDVLNGAGGNDYLTGGRGSDTLIGGDGDDWLEGFSDATGDWYGAWGEDTLIGGAGADRLNGYSTYTTASYETSGAGVIIDLGAGTGLGGDAQGDTLFSIERVLGSAHNDIILADGGANVLIGGAGNDVLYGNAGYDQLFGGDGDDVIMADINDDLDNVLGGAGYDIFVYTEGATPQFFNLAAHGFEAAEGRLTDSGNTQAWATRTFYHDGLWRLDREVLGNDDGTRTVLDYDQLGDQAWSLYWMQFDALNRADLEVLTYDSGARVNLDYDQANAYAWTTLWSQYDSVGNLVAEANDYDDGSRITLAHDVVDAFDWSENWVSYDALDRVDAEAIDYDDGSRITRDHDQNDAHNWTTDWVRYDALDRVDVQVITYDDGTYAVQDFDQADEHSWQSQWWLYDASDNLIAFQGINDDGSPFGGG